MPFPTLRVLPRRFDADDDEVLGVLGPKEAIGATRVLIQSVKSNVTHRRDVVPSFVPGSTGLRGSFTVA